MTLEIKIYMFDSILKIVPLAAWFILGNQTEKTETKVTKKENVKEEGVPIELVGDGERGGGLPRARRAVEKHVRQLRGTKQQIREISKGFLRIETMNLGDRRRVRV